MTECRICKEVDESVFNPLISPCACVGTVRFVHRDCLQRWVETSGTDLCNMCNTICRRNVVNNGPIPISLIQHLEARESMIRSIVALATAVFMSGIVLRAVITEVWRYILTPPLTATTVGVYYVASQAVYIGIGFTVGMLRQVTFSLNDRDYSLNGDLLILPVNNILSAMKFIVARYHITATGWTPAVMLMYYMAVYELATTVIFDDLLRWYRSHYIVSQF